MLLSHPALAIRVPSGENCTWLTLFWWPSSLATGLLPLLVGSHKYMVKSSPRSLVSGHHTQPSHHADVLAETSRSATLPWILVAFSNLSNAFARFPSSVSGTSPV